jgi:hypothetical protein
VAREVPQAQLRENGENRGYAAFASHVSGILDINAKSNVRHQRMIARRHKWADFREQRYLENFYFGFNPRINRTQVYELAARHFVRQRRDVLLVGPQHNRIPSWLSQRQDCPRSASNRCAFRPLPSQQWLALVKSSPQ